ncbi:transcription factor IIIB [Zalerion maritima]|uniref:Transcription factor IIIB n=1 Tax=Zalerion maritima TaxID=339359 RepID=A0AAD5RSP1_9PEZI|nr:transcription factor IIIB [Zalerion maritima]
MPPRQRKPAQPVRAAYNPMREMRRNEDAALAALMAKKKKKNEQAGKGAQKPSCPNKSCTNPDVVDGVCQSCGRIVDDSIIVADVQFGEAANGAAVLQGQYIAEDQGAVTSSHPAFRRLGGGSDSRERSIREAKGGIERIAYQLHIPDRIVTRAVQIFKLALTHRFTQGRRLPTVYAVCLYLACRSHKDAGESEDGDDVRNAFDDVVNRKPSENQIMLIDFADLIQVNVFRLGRAFKALHAVVPATENGWLPISPEDLIYRFAARLEFLHETDAVATTAVRLAKSMALDMMAEGRRPSGICGACLLMAARIHNFRRSVREVVYVVKVTMETIRIRMDEFRSTAASDMSVEQFLSDNWTAVGRAHPPAYYKSEYAQKMRLRKRKRDLKDLGAEEDGDEAAAEDVADIEEIAEDPKNKELVEELSSLPFVEYHRDENGRIIIPKAAQEDNIDGTDETIVNNLAEEFIEQEVQQTQKGNRKQKTLPINQSWRGEEEEIEQQITEMISDPATIQHTKAFEAAAKRAKVHHDIATRGLKDVSMDKEVGEDEFANDPEVQNCLLSEEEAKLKELLWVNENEQYLRKEQAKIFHDKITAKKPKSNRGRKKRGNGGPPDEPFATAGESALNMANRLHLSTRLDMNVFESMFSGNNGADGPRSRSSAVTSKRTSREGSTAVRERHDAQPEPGSEQDDEPEEDADGDDNFGCNDNDDEEFGGGGEYDYNEGGFEDDDEQGGGYDEDE